MSIIVIEDERHSEQQGQFANFKDAIIELERRSNIPWDKAPNQCPCTNWKNCGRTYEVIEYNNDNTPWKELRRIPVLEVSAHGVKWYKREFPV